MGTAKTAKIVIQIQKDHWDSAQMTKHAPTMTKHAPTMNILALQSRITAFHITSKKSVKGTLLKPQSITSSLLNGMRNTTTY